MSRFVNGLPTVLQKVVRIADTRIGARAVGTYMRNAKGEGRRSPNDSGPLRSVSSRLARAVQSRGGAFGKEYTISTTLTKSAISFAKSILVPYAAIHEFGGTITISITQKMRSFFWAMYIETKEENWKYMALTKKTEFEVVMGERAYIAPAIEDERDEIARRSAEALIEHIERSFK